jgi:predicted metal-dependent phosphoesterase TrpH
MAHAGAGGFIDLHTHSTASDGSRTPGDVVREGKRLGLVAMAITDHDTLDGVAEAQAVGSELGVRIVTGIELSAVEDDVETHVLGLHLSDTSELARSLAALRSMRLGRAERMVARLNDIGVRITFEDVLREAAGGAVGRPHIARAMVNDGWATDFRDAFDRYLGNGKVAFVQKDRLPLVDAIAMIHRAGGLAVLAHPGPTGSRARIEVLAAAGLDGVEVRHPGHSAEDTARLSALADHFGLVPSGGSDWHGATEGSRRLGMMDVPLEWLRHQEERLSSRAPAVGDGHERVA